MSTGPARLSPRLAAIVDALPLRPGMRVLEIGCGPGAAARAVAQRIGGGHVLAIDRSATAVRQAREGCAEEIAAGRLTVRRAAVEDFALEDGEAPYDLAFAIRVGALDGRHPQAEQRARERIARALTPEGRLFIDGGDPLREVPLEISPASVDDIPPGIGRPALRALAAAGYTSLARLASASPDEIAGLHGIGPKALRILREALAGRGEWS